VQRQATTRRHEFMPTARELTTPGAKCVGVEETLGQAAQKMRDLGGGSLPICGEDEAGR
jgi:hypothetical protein